MLWPWQVARQHMQADSLVPRLETGLGRNYKDHDEIMIWTNNLCRVERQDWKEPGYSNISAVNSLAPWKFTNFNTRLVASTQLQCLRSGTWEPGNEATHLRSLVGFRSRTGNGTMQHCDGAANLSGHYCMHRGLLLYEGVLARAGKTVPLVSSTFLKLNRMINSRLAGLVNLSRVHSTQCI